MARLVFSTLASSGKMISSTITYTTVAANSTASTSVHITARFPAEPARRCHTVYTSKPRKRPAPSIISQSTVACLKFSLKERKKAAPTYPSSPRMTFRQV